MFNLGAQQLDISGPNGIGAGDVIFSRRDSLENRVASERIPVKEKKDSTVELQFQLGDIRDRVEILEFEFNTRVLQRDCRSIQISEAGSSSKTSREPQLVQPRQSLPIKLPDIFNDLTAQQEADFASKCAKVDMQAAQPVESRLVQLEVRLEIFESGLANLNVELSALKKTFSRYLDEPGFQNNTTSRSNNAADDHDAESQSPQQTPEGLRNVIQAQDSPNPEKSRENIPQIVAQRASSYNFILAKSTWSLIFVLGHVQAAWFDEFISACLLVTSISMQVIFSVIVSLPSFLGDPFAEQKKDAEIWRRTVAHDFAYLDLAGSSLASRVCYGDGALIVSLGQRDLITHINGYLGTSADPTHEQYLVPPRLRPGIVLCLLCIFLWCLAVLTELRDTLSCIEAVWCLPKQRRTCIDNGHLASISHLRAIVVFACFLVRISLAVWLLITGVIWISNEISIQDLILNAAALVTVLDVDEMVFTAMMPRPLQTAIQNMKAIPIFHSMRYRRLQSWTLFLCMPATIIFSYYNFLHQLGSDMVTVKKRLCDGNIDFVFAQNGNTQLMYALRTKDFDHKHLSLAEESLQLIVDYSSSDWDDVPYISYTTMLDDAGSFILRSSEKMEEFSSQPRYRFNIACEDYDAIKLILEREPEEADMLDHSQKWALMERLTGITAASCYDLRQFCNMSDHNLVRFLCPRTCRCDDPYRGFILRTSKYGCPAACAKLRTARAKLGFCMDMPVDQDWTNMLTELHAIASNGWSQKAVQDAAPFYKNAHEYGCRTIAQWPIEPLLSINLCTGNSEFPSLTPRCPISCGCRGGGGVVDPSCPSCRQNWRRNAECLDYGTPDEPDGQHASCAEAREDGFCEWHDAAEMYCRATCGFCCADVGVQAESLFHLYAAESDNCSHIKAKGMCEELISFGSATYCRATCNLCTNTTPIDNIIR